MSDLVLDALDIIFSIGPGVPLHIVKFLVVSSQTGDWLISAIITILMVGVENNFSVILSAIF